MAAALPALLLSILIFMDQQITAVILNRVEYRLQVRTAGQGPRPRDRSSRVVYVPPSYLRGQRARAWTSFILIAPTTTCRRELASTWTSSVWLC